MVERSITKQNKSKEGEMIQKEAHEIRCYECKTPINSEDGGLCSNCVEKINKEWSKFGLCLRKNERREEE